MSLAAQLFTSSNEIPFGVYIEIPIFDGMLHVLVGKSEILEVKSDQISADVRRYFLGKESIGVADIKILLADLQVDWQVVVLVYERVGQVLFGNVGGYVWMKKGSRKGFLSKVPNDAEIKRGQVEPGDMMVFGGGDDLENLSKLDQESRVDDKQDFLQEILVDQSMGVVLAEEKQQEDGSEIDEVQDLKPAQIKIHAPKIKKKKNKLQSLLTRKPKTANPEVYIKSDERAKLGRVVVLVLVLLIISIGMGWRKRGVLEKENLFQESYEPALEQLIKAEGLMHDTPMASRDILLEAKKNIEQSMQTYEEDDGAKNKLETLLSQINTLYEKVSGEHMISSAEVFFDLTVVKDDVLGTQMSIGDGWISILDTSRHLAIGIEIESKKAQLLGGGDLLSGSKLLSASTGKAVVLSSKGLVGLFFGSREPELLVDYESEWEAPVALGMFGGNVYVIDADVQDIWRYPGFEGGVGSRVRWLGPGVLPLLSGVIDMSVDGDIWTLSSGGGIAHFRRGAQMNFSVSGMNTSLDGATKIYSWLERDELYVLDPVNRRVVVLSTKGEYKDQYVWDGIESANDLAVVDIEGEGIILLLSGSTVYSIPLGN